ncbi:nucleoside recognition domain-containing protein [Roseivirga pacifica]|uniref:nucleoside recognition domain-containing protein n=1 Tax=Roseivirga pacifica TaxID=1267423 RepID=UPI0020940D35|nr:spore maturation protein [Roseivirga pacifica]MCO6361018.1 hypothetical protein [Roseivirga pacifica]MCO6368907.1 hypothetical protein [Roseivirga pacifica]MCO6373050.1 hypothetical protein [Roseivirga pacifica]MCO6373130.1 hypothetical protein [Roseivirga pacifica]MCO6377613.1 hypothetical protein [Roseivirga pacifica]
MALNYIWIGFFLIAFLVALIKLIFFGDTQIFPQLLNTLFDAPDTAFKLSIGLTGALTFWMGVMRIGEKGGVVAIMSKFISPFFSKIFPEIPKNHPVFGPMLMNFSMNFLGLDNAATPVGLKTMEGLQELNPNKKTASNSQIMFLVLNTSGLTLIPVSIMAFRIKASNPADVFLPILMTTYCSTLIGLITVALIQKINLFNKVVLAYLGGITAIIVGGLVYFQSLPKEQLADISRTVAGVLLFGIITSFVLLAIRKKVNVYEAAIEGGKEGFNVAIRIIPYLVAILVSIGLFRASGALDFINDGFKLAFGALGVNTDFVDALPVAWMKPLSGSGARAAMVETFENFGIDSFPSKVASVLQGSTETTFYVLAVYFGAVKIKNTRYAATAGLIADLAGIIAAILISYLFFYP